ncbi:TolC family outer membrane protein [Mariluticola halotolerans]|uniref:TolC family outer membrane protein n=1 Tax=Mariluticola halotolerans TaxID=2909283 RepID=UPI0026E135EF|nr:TolC family outer membrane protein [Mariluticola halotolerans]UJQ95079.1 TolC family outer membrane protein [Mariluticola halotolerans]
MISKRVLRAGTFAAIALFAATPAFAESLRDALASAYANNPQIASALLSVKMSAEDIATRKAGKLPTIAASAEMKSSWTVSGGPGTSNQSSSVGLSYSQTLFDNLVTDAQIESARAYSVVAKEGLRTAEQNVLLSAASAYLDVVTNTKLVQLRAENVKFLQAQVQSSNDRLDIGEGTRIEVSQADASLASAIASYKSAIANLQTSQASYQRWIGHKPQNLSLDYSFNGILPGSIDQAQSSADSSHPEILAAKAQLRAAQAASDAAERAFGPTLKLIGSIGGSFSSPGTGTYTSTGTGSVGLTLSVPLYAGGALGAGARKANLGQIQSEIDALSVRDRIRAQVISSWSSLQNAAAQIDAAQSSVRANEQVLNGVIEERNVGQSTTLDVLDARAKLTSAQEGLIGAQTSRIAAGFNLMAAAGRLSARELGLPVQIKSADGYIKNIEDVWQELRSVAN